MVTSYSKSPIDDLLVSKPTFDKEVMVRAKKLMPFLRFLTDALGLEL